uniref:Transposase n=1 Tax=Steinernema glaseri TaxID=37863 RepID=A0A1I7Z725_9BILA
MRSPVDFGSALKYPAHRAKNPNLLTAEKTEANSVEIQDTNLSYRRLMFDVIRAINAPPLAFRIDRCPSNKRA